jgi:hypothetical protein
MSPFALVSLRRASALAVTFFLFSVAGLKNSSNRTLVAATPTARLRLARAGLPLSFETNLGQTDPRVKFVSRGRGYTLFLTKDEAVLGMQKSEVRGQKSGARSHFATALDSLDNRSPRIWKFGFGNPQPGASENGTKPDRVGYLRCSLPGGAGNGGVRRWRRRRGSASNQLRHSPRHIHPHANGRVHVL